MKFESDKTAHLKKQLQESIKADELTSMARDLISGFDKEFLYVLIYECKLKLSELDEESDYDDDR